MAIGWSPAAPEWQVLAAALNVTVPAVLVVGGVWWSVSFRSKSKRLVGHLRQLKRDNANPELDEALAMLVGREGRCRKCGHRLEGDWCQSCASSRHKMYGLGLPVGGPVLGFAACATGTTVGPSLMGMDAAVSWAYILGLGGVIAGLVFLFTDPYKRW